MLTSSIFLINAFISKTFWFLRRKGNKNYEDQYTFPSPERVIHDGGRQLLASRERVWQPDDLMAVATRLNDSCHTIERQLPTHVGVDLTPISQFVYYNKGRMEEICNRESRQRERALPLLYIEGRARTSCRVQREARAPLLLYIVDRVEERLNEGSYCFRSDCKSMCRFGVNDGAEREK